MGGYFPTWCTAGVRGKAVARRGEHSALTQGAHSEGTVALAKMAPRDAQRHMGANATAHQQHVARQVL